jgi:hypothetical protein
MKSSNSIKAIVSCPISDLATDRSDLFKILGDRIDDIFLSSRDETNKQASEDRLIDLRAWLNTEVIRARQARRGFYDAAVLEWDRHWMEFAVQGGTTPGDFPHAHRYAKARDRKLNALSSQHSGCCKTLSDLWWHSQSLDDLLPLITIGADKKFITSLKLYLCHAIETVGAYKVEYIDDTRIQNLVRGAIDKINGRADDFDFANDFYYLCQSYRDWFRYYDMDDYPVGSFPHDLAMCIPKANGDYRENLANSVVFAYTWKLASTKFDEIIESFIPKPNWF